jgi:ribosomal protein S18 acetylase RimI-like enzyme
VRRPRAEPGRPGNVAIVAVSGEVIEFVTLVLDDEGWGSFVNNLHVLSPCQGQGVGSALMSRAAKAVAAGAAKKSLCLWALEQNTSTQAFYTALGGTPAGQAIVTPADAPSTDNL